MTLYEKRRLCVVKIEEHDLSGGELPCTSPTGNNLQNPSNTSHKINIHEPVGNNYKNDNQKSFKSLCKVEPYRKCIKNDSTKPKAWGYHKKNSKTQEKKNKGKKNLSG